MMQFQTKDGGVRSLLAKKPAVGQIGLAWLGQAGFAVTFGDLLLLIDPYLSDHLAKKYKGTIFPHVRMMPPPIDPAALTGVDAVLCSHRHGDHTDPGSLPTIARNNPQCRLIVPRAELESAAGIGLPEAQTEGINAGERVALSGDVTLEAIASAHETLKVNPQGEHHYLGFVLQLGPITLYHAGDCVPYGGLLETLRARAIDVALLPVNGRDATRRSHGVPGNMTFAEAKRLCTDAGMRALIPHHFGMFDFNTADPEALRQEAAACTGPLQCIVPDVDKYLVLAS